MTVTVTIPLMTKSTANLREHWAARARRLSEERGVTAMRLAPHRQWLRERHAVTVTLCRRHTARRLDDDNLRGALKAVRDGVADVLGVDDGDRDRVTWHYEQEKVPKHCWGVVITITERVDA